MQKYKKRKTKQGQQRTAEVSVTAAGRQGLQQQGLYSGLRVLLLCALAATVLPEAFPCVAHEGGADG